MRFAFVLLLVACSTKTDPPKQPCKRVGTLEIREVDEDSEYMKKLFSHVGYEGRDGQPHDPAAIEAGVRVEIDQWRQDHHTEEDEFPKEPGPIHTDYYALAHDRAKLEGYLAAWDKPPSDREVVLEYVTPFQEARDPRPYWRTYYVVRKPILDTRDLADVKLAKHPVSEGPMLAIKLTPTGKQQFAAETEAAAKTGKKLATVVDGIVESAPIINGRIAGGGFSINVVDRAEADALLAKLACVK